MTYVLDMAKNLCVSQAPCGGSEQGKSWGFGLTQQRRSTGRLVEVTAEEGARGCAGRPVE